MNKTSILSLIVTGLIGFLTTIFSILFSRQKIKNLKNEKKALEQEVKNEKLAKETKKTEIEGLSDIDKKTNDEIIELWKNKE